QRERRHEALADADRHGLVVDDRVAEVAAQELAQPEEVAHVERLVEAQLVALALDVERAQVRVDQQVDPAARRQVDDRVADDGDPEEHRQGYQEPAEDEAKHRDSPGANTGLARTASGEPRVRPYSLDSRGSSSSRSQSPR